MAAPIGTKVGVALVTGELGVAVAAVTQLVEDGTNSGATNAIIGTALLGAVSGLGFVIRAMITGRLVPQNVAETRASIDRVNRNLDTIASSLDRIEHRLERAD